MNVMKGMPRESGIPFVFHNNCSQGMISRVKDKNTHKRLPNRRSKVRRLAVLALGILILLAVIGGGCAKPAAVPLTAAPAPAPPKTLDIGIATSLTGPYASLGVQMQNGTLLAIDDQNKEGGVTIAGQQYMINPIIRDTKQDLVLGRSIAEELVFDKGVKVIAGPFISDAIGAQRVTEPNKVIAFLVGIIIPGMCGPDKPFSFFCEPTLEQFYGNQAAYLQKFYPKAKTVVSVAADIPSVPSYVAAIKAVFPQYGLEWQGLEKFPLGTEDLSPVISRMLAKNPDIIDLCTTGGMSGIGSLALKQVRQAGFKGPIMVPFPPLRRETEEVIPKEYLDKVIMNYNDLDSPMVSQAFRDVYHRAKEKFREDPETLLYLFYNPVKAFFQFLNGQTTMDSTAWMQGYAKYHWQGIFGIENFWVGKKVNGIDRRIFIYPWVSEYINGKLVTQFSAPIPYDMFVEK